MSKDNVKQMFGKMEKDAALKAKYAELMQAHQKDAEKAMAEKLIEFGKTSGFAFSKDDLLAARAELMDNVNSNNELSDKDLTKVAGGATIPKTSLVAISILTIGTGCAEISISSELSKKGGCGETMSTTVKC